MDTMAVRILGNDNLSDSLDVLSCLTSLASDYASEQDSTMSESGKNGLSYLMTIISHDLKQLARKIGRAEPCN